MRILIVSATYPPSTNGVAISTQRTVKELKKQGHHVYVAAPKHKFKKEQIDIELPSVNNPFIKDYPLVLPFPSHSLITKIKKINIDIIHVHHPLYIGNIARFIGKTKKTPIVFTYHTRYDEYAHQYLPFLPEKAVKQQINKKIKKFCEKCNAVIATTKTFQQKLKKSFSVPVYYASTAGLPKIKQNTSNAKFIRKKFNIPNSKSILINVSRHVIEKNLQLILQTASLLDPNKFFTIMIGDGSYSKDLKKMAQKLNLQNSIKFLGKISQKNLFDYLSASDIFLYSSTTDTIGINILEAMAVNLPVIAVKDKNTAEVVKHHQNGYLLPPDPKKFAKHILLLKENPNSKNNFQIMLKTQLRIFLLKTLH